VPCDKGEVGLKVSSKRELRHDYIVQWTIVEIPEARHKHWMTFEKILDYGFRRTPIYQSHLFSFKGPRLPWRRATASETSFIILRVKLDTFVYGDHYPRESVGGLTQS